MTNPAFPRHPPRCSALRHPTRNRGAAARLRTRRNRPVPGCRGRACPVPFLQLARLQDGRPQGSPLQGPVSNSCTVPGRSCRGRACPVPFLQLARLQDGRPQGSPLQGPVSNSCTVPGRSCRGRACPVPFLQLARLQDGRPQGSPLQGPVSNSCTVPGRSCRGRACPVPFLQLARLRDGRPQGSPLQQGNRDTHEGGNGDTRARRPTRGRAKLPQPPAPRVPRRRPDASTLRSSFQM